MIKSHQVDLLSWHLDYVLLASYTKGSRAQNVPVQRFSVSLPTNEGYGDYVPILSYYTWRSACIT